MEALWGHLHGAVGAMGSPTLLLIMLAGVAIGIILGAMPGFGSSQALALLFPLTFAMSVDQAVLFFLAVYSAVEYGSSIPAILIRTPGSGASAITVLDGYAMARKGLARKALRISLYTGCAGGIISTVIFILAGTTLGHVALMFGPGELFAVGVFGLSIVASFFGGDAARGFLAAGIGLLLATVGSSGFGGLRFTFEQGYLTDGIPLVVIIIAFLAGPEAFRLLVDHRRVVEPRESGAPPDAGKDNRISPAEARALIPTVLRSSLIGTAVGIIPGAGASVAAMLAYSEEQRWSKRPREFGTGINEGIAAPECANNAVVAGTLVPSLSLGIPGSGGAAILLGVLISKGVVPGPLLFRDHGTFVMTVFVGLLVVNVMMLVVGLIGNRPFGLVARVPMRILGPFVLLLIVVGTYAYANYAGHVVMVLVLSAIAYHFEKIHIPVVPIVLAFIMGPIIEDNFSRALTISAGDLSAVLLRPITAVILVLALATAVYSVRAMFKAVQLGASER
ncbi:MAG TPA: tripartite tricarboxylate transporter permease [Burkholderiales bacterium]|nr:tripartite tricarboxylate transporter permease [Burkholderiales bacterium]